MNSSPQNIAKRYRRERRFVMIGKACTFAALLFLVLLIIGVVSLGWRGLISAELELSVTFDPEIIGTAGSENVIKYQKLLTTSLVAKFPELDNRRGRKELNKLVSFSAGQQLKQAVIAKPELVGTTGQYWLQASSLAELYLKGALTNQPTKGKSLISVNQTKVLDSLAEDGATRLIFNRGFFTNADSRDPEVAGVAGAVVGSFYTLLITFLISFPLAVMTALYLELFARRNWFFALVEVNINNLAAVPSVIFGLLGLGIFINLFGVPRSTPLVGGLVLSLLTLPTMVIASRAAINSVPPSMQQAAVALGATKMQAATQHVLPLAMPGILTGTIIGMAGALGESAPLILIGMIAFLTEIPDSVFQSATTLPAQIFLWADSPSRGFVERVALAIISLLCFLALMNAVAVWFRTKFEIKT